MVSLSIVAFIDFVRRLKYLASDWIRATMNAVKRIVLLLLLGGLVQATAQERSDVRREQEKKETEKKETSEEAAPRRSVRPSLRDALARPAGESVQPGRDIPIPESGSDLDARSSKAKAAQAEEVRRVFNNVEDGFSEGSIGRFSPHFGSQVALSLRGGENGSYSANQAYYVLENYLRTRRLVDFSFESVSEFGANPYATGNAGFAVRSGKESAQVYVALARAGGKWVITQINIY
jgi:hypothetical protein